MNAVRPASLNIERPYMGFAAACLIALNAASAAAQSASNPASQPGFPNWGVGSSTAPVTLLEYGSLTCGGCAAFATSIFPTIKRRYIDAGQVRYVLRPSPTPPIDLSVAMHALTLCAGSARHYPLLEAFFERQREVLTAAVGETGPKGTIFAIAEDVGGLSYSASEACLRDPARLAQVRASAAMATAAGVASTPSFFVNSIAITAPAGQQITEARLVAAIDAALRTTPQRRGLAKKAKKR